MRADASCFSILDVLDVANPVSSSTPPSRFSWRAWELVKTTADKWSGDPVPRFAAALAYYTAFAIVPLVVLVVMVSVTLMGEETTKGNLHRHLGDVIGNPAADGLIRMVDAWRHAGSPIRGVLVDFAVFIVAAARVMDQLQDALDCIWGLRPERQPTVWERIKQRWFSRLGLLGIAFILLASLLASAVLGIGIQSVIRSVGTTSWLSQAAGAIISYLAVAGLFVLVYKWVPRAKVAWSDVWIGALITAALYVAGSRLIVGYLGHSPLVEFYGGAGSLVMVLLWAYYASQIFLFGAIFIAVYASEVGSQVVPAEGARAVRRATESDEEESSKQAS